MNTWGHNLRLSIFGESHGPAVGITVDGLPAGEHIDEHLIASEMARRAPGASEFSTPRKEADHAEIISGLYKATTTGSPLTAIIHNTNVRSADYDANVLRPGHADWTALLKYGGHADMRGGGHFSGRLTAPLVFAGALAKQVLAQRGVVVHARITSIGGAADNTTQPDEAAYAEAYAALTDKPFAVWSDAAAHDMQEEIRAAKQAGDSVGGCIEVVAFGVPGGLGSPFFASLESSVAALLFSIPAVKGVEFGGGFALAEMRGSEANDVLYMESGAIRTQTNHNGGILGGITNGMPVVARVAIKPTPSIALPQQTVDAQTLQNTEISVQGRHDPCIVPRAVPVCEAALALAILDALLGAEAGKGQAAHD